MQTESIVGSLMVLLWYWPWCRGGRFVI